jgi:hypothetical protein
MPRQAGRLKCRVGPFDVATSAPQMPQASTSIRTSPGAGVGVLRSTSSSVPGWLTCIARYVVFVVIESIVKRHPDFKKKKPGLSARL